MNRNEDSEFELWKSISIVGYRYSSDRCFDDVPSAEFRSDSGDSGPLRIEFSATFEQESISPKPNVCMADRFEWDFWLAGKSSRLTLRQEDSQWVESLSLKLPAITVVGRGPAITFVPGLFETSGFGDYFEFLQTVQMPVQGLTRIVGYHGRERSLVPPVIDLASGQDEPRWPDAERYVITILTQLAIIIRVAGISQAGDILFEIVVTDMIIDGSPVALPRSI